MDKYNLPNNALSYVFIVFAVLLILRCSNYADKSNENALNIDIKDTISTFSDIFKSVTYIPLETTPNSLIGEPKKLVQYQDKFFILDYQTNSLLIFNMNGKFIKNLCIQGKGPGEVMSIRDFAINAYSNTIEVYDNLLFKILKYNLKGNLLEEKKIKIINLVHHNNTYPDTCKA